jgi:hypothetical protein
MDGNGPDGNTKGSEGLARMGAVSIWLSVGVLLLSLMIIFSYMISQTGEVVTEDDFTKEAEDLWTADMEVGEMGSISIFVDSSGPVEIELTLLDDRGRVERTFSEKTPLEEEVIMLDGGWYTIEIVILEEGTEIDDLEIELLSTGMDTFNVCIGSVCLGGLFLMIGTTGLVFTILAISRRNSELRPPEILPPWLAWSQQPVPPSRYPSRLPPEGPGQTGQGENWGKAEYWNRRGSGRW